MKGQDAPILNEGFPPLTIPIGQFSRDECIWQVPIIFPNIISLDVSAALPIRKLYNLILVNVPAAQDYEIIGKIGFYYNNSLLNEIETAVSSHTGGATVNTKTTTWSVCTAQQTSSLSNDADCIFANTLVTSDMVNFTPQKYTLLPTYLTGTFDKCTFSVTRFTPNLTGMKILLAVISTQKT